MPSDPGGDRDVHAVPRDREPVYHGGRDKGVVSAQAVASLPGRLGDAHRERRRERPGLAGNVHEDRRGVAGRDLGPDGLSVSPASKVSCSYEAGVRVSLREAGDHDVTIAGKRAARSWWSRSVSQRTSASAGLARHVSTGDVDLDRLARAAAAGNAAGPELAAHEVQPGRVAGPARGFSRNREDAEEACQDTLLAGGRGIGSLRRSGLRSGHGCTASPPTAPLHVPECCGSASSAESGGAPPPDQPDPRRTSVVAGTRLDLLDGSGISLGPGFGRTGHTARRSRPVLSGHRRAFWNMPEGTVKSRIHAGRLRLREQLFGDASDLTLRGD